MKNDILRGHTEHIILSILKSNQSNGVSLLSKVNSTLSHDFEIKKITMYKTLNRLEQSNMIHVTKRGKENIYSITDEGINHLDDLSKEWDYTKSIIDSYDHLSDIVIGSKIKYLKETTSTNDEIKKFIHDENEGLVLYTDFQSEGRGRLNRKWESKPGDSLMMSLLLYPKIKVADIGLITQVAAAAIYDTLKTFDVDELTIKWPNDIMVGVQKVGGVLVESKLIGNKVDYVIIGIGLNIKSTEFNENLVYKATALNDHTASDITRDDVMRLLIQNLNRYYLQFINNNYEFLSVCRDNSFLIGKFVSIHTDEEEIVEVVGINDSGALLVNRKGTIESVLLNEVTLSSIYGGVEHE